MATDPPAGERAIVDALIEESIAPYRGLVSPEILAAMAENIELFLTTHPTASKMVERVRARIVAKSAEVDRGDDAAERKSNEPSGTEGER